MNLLQIAGGILGIALTLGLAAVAWDCWTVHKEYAEFRAGVEKAGKEAKEKADRKEAADKLAKETADAEAKRLMADNAALADKLRRARSSSSFLPPASPLAASPGRACFSRAEFERTLQRLDAGVSDLVAEGDAARIGLETARKWASDVAKAEK